MAGPSSSERGVRAGEFTPRQQDVLLARMVPFVVRNYNMIELGPRGTGKSHLFQQVSPYAHLVSGGKATVANMFVNMNTGRRGLVAQYDVVCFDEVSGVSFDQKDGVNILKGYMESGEFSRGRESIRAEGGIVMVGNFDVDVWEQLRRGHLLCRSRRRCGTTPPSWTGSTRTSPAGMFRSSIPSYFTHHFGFVSDFLAECWTLLRRTSRLDVLQGRVGGESSLSGRDRRPPTTRSTDCFGSSIPIRRWRCRTRLLRGPSLSLEMRRRVKEPQAWIGPASSEGSIFATGGRQVSKRSSSTARRQWSTPGEGGEDGTGLGPWSRRRRLDRVPARPRSGGHRTSRRRGHASTASGTSLGAASRSRGAWERGILERLPSTGRVEEASRALKLFESAAGYDAVRREMRRYGRSTTQTYVKVIWADRTHEGEWYLILEYVQGELPPGTRDRGEGISGSRGNRCRDGRAQALEAIHPDATV